MGNYIPPSAFYTFEPIIHDPLILIEPILLSIGGDHEELKKIIPNSKEINSLKDGEVSPYDHATSLF